MVQTLTGVNLATVSDDPATALTELEALCEGAPLNGTFVPADEVQTTNAAFNSGTILDVREPLEAQIAAQGNADHPAPGLALPGDCEGVSRGGRKGEGRGQGHEAREEGQEAEEAAEEGEGALMRIGGSRRAGGVLAVGVVVIAVAALVAAPSAFGHVKVKRTSPESGGSAPTSTSAVRVVFNGPLQSGTLKVKGPGGDVVSEGKGGRDPRNVKRLTVGLESGLDSGTYKVKWKIVAADGHEQDGKFSFKLTG